MHTITTTQLRTKSKDLVQRLFDGESINLIHRSKIIGEIKPKIEDPEPFDPKEFNKLLSGLKLPEVDSKDYKKLYRKHLEEKYGKTR